MICKRLGLHAAFVLALAIAGGARAQTMLQSGPGVGLVQPVAGTASGPIDLSISAAALSLAEAQSKALRDAGVAQTSIDHHFAGDAVTGSLGFLCGRQPSYLRGGVADARGYDPEGKFVGAKLAFAFR